MHSSATPEHSLSNVNASDVEIRALTLQLEELSRQHQADLEICEVHERKVPILREDSVLLDEDVMELTRRLDKAQRLLIQKVAERITCENMADFIRDRISKSEQKMDEIRATIQQLTAISSPRNPEHYSNGQNRHISQTPTGKISSDSVGQAMVSHHSSPHPTQQAPYAFEAAICVDFNKHQCHNMSCSDSHICLYCHSSSHTLLTCDQKGCICVYYNKNECDIGKCSRINICLFCLGDHPISRCPEMSENDRTEAKDICNNWNAMSFCQTEHCRRLHKCLRCQEKHTTFECPRNVKTYAENPTISRIFNQYKAKVIVVRHEPYRAASQGSDSVVYGKSGARDRGYRDDDSRDRGWDRSGTRDQDEYRKRNRDEEPRRSGEGRYDDRSGGEFKRSRNDDDLRKDTGSNSGAGGRYSRRREEEQPRTTSESRPRDRSNERGSSGSFEDDDRKQAREKNGMNPCFVFNEKGSCHHGQKCWYRHACIKCDSFSHGEFECPKR